METKDRIELIDKVLRCLDGVAIVGLRNCGKLWNAGCELERLRFDLERERTEEIALGTSDEQEDKT